MKTKQQKAYNQSNHKNSITHQHPTPASSTRKKNKQQKYQENYRLVNTKKNQKKKNQSKTSTMPKQFIAQKDLQPALERFQAQRIDYIRR